MDRNLNAKPRLAIRMTRAHATFHYSVEYLLDHA